MLGLETVVIWHRRDLPGLLIRLLQQRLRLLSNHKRNPSHRPGVRNVSVSVISCARACVHGA